MDETVGALCHDDYKGINNQYVGSGKVIVVEGVRGIPIRSLARVPKNRTTAGFRRIIWGGSESIVMDNKGIITYDVVLPVSVRKHEVDADGLRELLRSSLKRSGMSRKELADKLDIPQTEVDHWFRTDDYFAVPNASYWFKLKQLIGIETDEYDAQVSEFVEKDCTYDMQNRIYDARGISPTITSTGADKTILDAPDDKGVAVDVRNSKEYDKNGALQSRASNNLQSNNVVRTQYAVRRLTPTEAERLQGLPDDFTLIDDKSCSDSARYKALGNGMAQPCADFVIRRIVEEVNAQGEES